MGVSCWKGHYQLSSLDTITSVSLSDGLPKNFFCFVPMSSAVLNITIDTEVMYGNEDEPEEEETDDDDDDDNGEEESGDDE